MCVHSVYVKAVWLHTYVYVGGGVGVGVGVGVWVCNSMVSIAVNLSVISVADSACLNLVQARCVL